MTCISCKTGLLEPAAFVNLPAEIKGVQVVVTMPGLVCSNCGYTTVHGSAMQEYMRLAADTYRAKAGLLTSSDIRNRRKALRRSSLDSITESQRSHRASKPQKKA